MLLDHPEQITPYTPNPPTANIYKIPTLISAYTIPSPKGITAQPITAKKNVKIGDKIKIPLCALAGIIVSFKKSFNPSARG